MNGNGVSGWKSWTNGLIGAFIGAATGVTTVSGVDVIGTQFGFPASFNPYQPGGIKKLLFVALGMGVSGAFTWLHQHPTPFPTDTTTASMAVTTQPGAPPKLTTTVTETHTEPKP